MPIIDGPSAFTGAIATPHALATEAGMRAYRDGGTAIDAAIAAAAVLTVVYPHNVALGGDLIALVRTQEGEVTCVNASGWAADGVDSESLRDRYGLEFPTRGVDTITVPGGVRGWQALRRMGSRLSWQQTLQEAEGYAEAGVPVAVSLAAAIDDPDTRDLDGAEDFDRVFRPHGRLMRAGDEFRQPALASAFRALRKHGPEEFYEGDLARRSVEFLQERGSVLTLSDFADFQPEITAPISAEFGELTVHTSPPNTHGFLMLRALSAVAEQAVSDPLHEGLGTLMRIFHRGNELRTARLADPRFAAVDVDALVHDDLRSLTPIGDGAEDLTPVPHGDTVGIAAVDDDGVAVSLIQSVYHAFGSGLIDPQTGILFHDRGAGFSLNPASANVIAARKRPAHTLMPVMCTQNGELRYVLATMGGQGQPQILTEILLRALSGMNAADAVSAPRAIVGRQAHNSTRDSVFIESDTTSDARSSLERAGLPTVEVPRHTEDLGQANVVFATADGRLTAASDPRSDGAAIVAHFARNRRTV